MFGLFRPIRKDRRSGTGWRGLLGLGVSVAAHAAVVAALTLFVASSGPDSGTDNLVPINVYSGRGKAVPERATAPAVVAGVPAGLAVRNREMKAARRAAYDDGRATAAAADTATPATAATTGDEPDGLADQAQARATPESRPDSGGDGFAAGSGNGDGSGGGTGGAGHAASAGTDGGTTGGGSSAHITAGSGVSGSGVGPDPVAVYAMMVRKALERRGAYPGTARRLGLEGRVEMIVSIDGSGTVSGTSILTSSGYPQLDDAARASAGRLRGLPAPPGSRPVEIMVPVRFSMRRN